MRVGDSFEIFRNGRSEGVHRITGETQTLGRPAFVFDDGRVLTKTEVEVATHAEIPIGYHKIKLIPQ